MTKKTKISDESAVPKAEIADTETTQVAPEQPNTPPKGFKRLVAGYWRKKRWTLPLTVLVVLAVMVVMPLTRYPVLGLFIKKNFTIQVLDETSQKPVTKAQVQLGSTIGQTDAQGKITLHVPVGQTQLEVTKKYFKTTATGILVPFSQKDAPRKVSIKATGRQVPVLVTNKLTGKPVSGATIAGADAEAKTDKDGKATLVVPADKKSVKVKITATGLNAATATLQVTEQVVTQNTFQLVSTGKVYFLSKLSGKIDVVKTNLDGSDRQTVLAGTGKEQSGDTIMLASRDWKYLAIKSLRDGGANAKLFLMDTTTEKIITMDEGDAGFEAVGWSDHYFVYRVSRNNRQLSDGKAQALKTYNAESNKLLTLDESEAVGNTPSGYYAYNYFSPIYLMDNEIIYTKWWYSSYNYFSPSLLNGKSASLYSVKPDGTSRKIVKDFPIPDNTSYFALQTRLYAPRELYVQVPRTNVNDKLTYYEYENGKIAAVSDVTDQEFDSPYPTYLESPSGKQTVWSDSRDGKNVFFIGNEKGEAGKEVASLSEYTPYGWYTDDYVLVSKNGSELYAIPATGGALLKITDYHKPDYSFRGYGGGYGGL